jgi:hypothetical protein
MSEESEEMLKENDIAATKGIKEGGIEVSIADDHGNACC